MKSFSRPDYRALINALSRSRKAAELTQVQLAERLSRPQSFVAKIERFERRLDVAEFIDICKALNVEPHEMINEANRK